MSKHTAAKIYALFDTRDPERARYVGHTVTSLHRRWLNHVSIGTRRIYDIPVCNWIASIGRDNVGIRELAVCTYEDRLAAEAEWVKKLSTQLANGGCNELVGNTPSKRLRELWSEQLTGIARSDETRLRMSAANKKTAEGRVFPVGAHKISNHNRWHVKRSMINENCELCLDDGS